MLVEPQDEINLEEPEIKETKAVDEDKTEVNILGEFVYDTKPQNDPINKTLSFF